MTADAVDYTADYNRVYGTDYLAVHARGRLLMGLAKLDPPVRRRDSGTKRLRSYPYEAMSAWLSCTARPDRDDYARVHAGKDFELLTAEEAKPFLTAARSGGCMLDHVGPLF